MESQTISEAIAKTSRLSLSSAAILGLSLAGGLLVFSFAQRPQPFLYAVLGVAALAPMLLYPELALAAYVVVGDVKGDDRVASLLPVDLTLAVGAVLLIGIAVNFLRRKPTVPLPRAYWLFIPLVALMTISLLYTPDFGAGLDKLARFLTVTGVVIVAPFFVLGTPRAMRRFLVGFAAVAFAICAWSLSGLGGSERLVTPSDNTIGLGHIACALILLLWFGIVARSSFRWRLLAYALLVVPAIALIGSGSRGSAIACVAAIVCSVCFQRRLLLDLGSLAALGAAALPFLDIPSSSISYLGTLVTSRSVDALMEFRGDLLDYGWQLVQKHPLFGVGIEGFRYRSPNAALYKWPHNVFLEVACEMGIPAALIVIAIFASAVRESWRQLRARLSPLFLFSPLTAALLLVGIVNATNTGNINSDRSTWLFVSLVFVVRGFHVYGKEQSKRYGESLRLLTA